MKPEWMSVTMNVTSRVLLTTPTIYITQNTHATVFCGHWGVSFSELHEKGIDAVVARMQLTYKVPLRCDDEFISRMGLKKQGLRWVFTHDIFRASDECLCFHADVDLVTLINGKLGLSKEYDEAFSKVLE